ncbi:unnamed protein product [Diamesa hyperborea]
MESLAMKIPRVSQYDYKGAYERGESIEFDFHDGQLYRLNVGGKIFLTIKRMISNYGTGLIFDQIIAYKYGLELEFFIDCDPEMFRHIHNFYRTGKTLLPDQFDEHLLLMEEAKTFGMYGGYLLNRLACIGDFIHLFTEMVQSVRAAYNQRRQEKLMKIRH